MKNLSPADFYNARNALGLSLSTVAKESEINRNYLSNFEKKKHFLDDTAKVKLRDYYLSIDPDVFIDQELEERDAEVGAGSVDANDSSSLTKVSAVSLLSDMGYRLVDGRYVVPAATDDDLIESERDEMHSIDMELNDLLSEKIPTENLIFGGVVVNKEEALKKSIRAIAMIARKQIHHDKMQGLPVMPVTRVVEGSIFDFDKSELGETTVGGVVSRVLHPDNKLSQLD